MANAVCVPPGNRTVRFDRPCDWTEPMKPTHKKHIPYYTVLEALRKAKGCAMCELEAAAVHRHLDSLLYESVNDPGVRENLIRSKGYCLRHAHLLLGFQNGLGTAILYQDQVRLFLDFLASLQGLSAKVRKKNASAAWGRHDACPACRLQVEGRQSHTEVLLEGLADAEMRGAFEAGPGLCVPHFLFALDKTPDAGTGEASFRPKRSGSKKCWPILRSFAASTTTGSARKASARRVIPGSGRSGC